MEIHPIGPVLLQLKNRVECYFSLSWSKDCSAASSGEMNAAGSLSGPGMPMPFDGELVSFAGYSDYVTGTWTVKHYARGLNVFSRGDIIHLIHVYDPPSYQELLLRLNNAIWREGATSENNTSLTQLPFGEIWANIFLRFFVELPEAISLGYNS